MRETHTVNHAIDPDELPRFTKEERDRLDAMTDEQAHRNALDDPDNPPMVTEERGAYRRIPDVRELRERLSMSQTEFADAFGIPVGVIRDWEQRRVFPNQAARSYLQVIAAMPEAVRTALKAS